VSTERPRLSSEWSLAGHPCVVLENRFVRAVVLPGLGGKVVSLVDKAADVELLWRNERVPLRAAAPGSSFDDQFAGGWDEMFPNDEPEELAGEPMPDHGELWTLPWAARSGADGDRVWVELEVRTPASTSTVRRRLTLGTDGSLVADYHVRNDGRRALPHLFKSHLAVALQPDTVVDLAAEEVLVHEFGEPRARPPGGRTRWPWLAAGGERHDLRRQPWTGQRGVSELLIATSMTRGWCAVDHPAAGSGLTLTWDVDRLPSCWLFGSYGGGWRGLDVLVLEPCTGHPLSVAEGVAAGTHQVLPAGQTVEWQLVAEVGSARPGAG
jgi:hypothetical protein